MRKNGFLRQIACLLGLVTVISLSGCGSTVSPAPSAEADDTAKREEALELFDPNVMPADIGEVIYVSGSWYDMGYQYGLQVGDIIARTFVASEPKLIATCGSKEAMYEQTQRYLDAVKERSQEMYDLVAGMAEGSGFDLLDTAIGTVFSVTNYEEKTCSTVSAWGEATGGAVYAAVNGDGSYGSKYYYPALVAFPENGYAFISYRGFFTNCMMNEKGLVAMTSLGQSAQPGDNAVGRTGMTTCMEVMWQCATAQEAKELFLEGSIQPGSGENFHCVDESGDAIIIEHTADTNILRQSGDYGEQDYMIANNHFLADELQDSLFQPEWTDCWPRYWTVEQFIRKDFGEVSLSTLNSALSSKYYYADGAWSEQSAVEMGGTDWTPECFLATYKTHSRGLIDVQNRTFYRQDGGADTINNMGPDTTGNLCKLTLGDSVSAVNDSAKMDAYLMVGQAQNELGLEKNPDETRLNSLNEAKRCLLAGLSYNDLAAYEEDATQAIVLYGQATSQFCKAQRLAQSACGESVYAPVRSHLD